MNLKQIEYFISVSETLNFTAAAKKCFVSQAAITQQIKALEEKLGVTLFVRSKHKVELTPAGYSYLADARIMLEHLEAAQKRALNAASGISGSIRIGYIRGYEYENISSLLRTFHESYPNIHMELIPENMSRLYEMLEDRQCDVILNLSPYKRSYPQFHHLHLKDYPLFAVLYPGHPLEKKGKMNYADLKNENFLIMQPEDRPNDEAEEVLLCYERGGFIPNIIHREREIQNLLLMVSAGLGIAILPEYCIRYFSTALSLVMVPLQKMDGTPEIFGFEAAWYHSNGNPAVPRFLDFFNPKR